MPERVADKDYYADADGKLVEADDPNAAFLVAREGTAVSDAAAKQYGLESLQVAETYDAVADHAVKHGRETEAQAADARQRMLAGQPDPDGEPVEGERGDAKAARPAANKARTDASNK